MCSGSLFIWLKPHEFIPIHCVSFIENSFFNWQAHILQMQRIAFIYNTANSSRNNKTNEINPCDFAFIQHKVMLLLHFIYLRWKIRDCLLHEFIFQTKIFEWEFSLYIYAMLLHRRANYCIQANSWYFKWGLKSIQQTTWWLFALNVHYLSISFISFLSQRRKRLEETVK